MDFTPGGRWWRGENQLAFSEPHSTFMRTNRCVNGHSYMMVRIVAADGRRIPSIVPYSVMPTTAQAVCKRCEARWPVFGSGVTVYRAPQSLQEPSVVATETLRYSEYIGDDEHIIDGTNSAIATRTTVRAARGWRQAYSLNVENAQTRTIEGGTGSLLPVSLRGLLEKAITETYSLNVENDNQFEQEVDVEVPPRTMLTLTLRWKRIWQGGLLSVAFDERTVEVPYRVAVGVSFDQVLSTSGG
jgi:hypothetical protein